MNIFLTSKHLNIVNSLEFEGEELTAYGSNHYTYCLIVQLRERLGMVLPGFKNFSHLLHEGLRLDFVVKVIRVVGD